MKSVERFDLMKKYIYRNKRFTFHTGLKNRRLKIFCFPPEFEMKFHIYVVPKCCCYDEDSVANLAFIRGQR